MSIRIEGLESLKMSPGGIVQYMYSIGRSIIIYENQHNVVLYFITTVTSTVRIGQSATN